MIVEALFNGVRGALSYVYPFHTALPVAVERDGI
jgi:hypothetical protein